ncbi:MAG: chitobiase/beta-hexosaminidase C-terminal domain-containing protein, partial [Bacteroidales bacterium]|nr:chitobiase/beta-hexosaminidase C-terminal domain-containing protein [Bacteroidales bacterium]
FSYIGTEAGDQEPIYKVRYWTGDEPWLEPENWNLDDLNNQITVTAVNNLGVDWTAGDTTAIVSKINNLVFTPAPGYLNNPATVTITTSTTDVTIYLAFVDSETVSLDSLYSGPITVDSSLVIKAIAFKDGWQDSDTATAVYTFMVDTVEFNVSGGSYSTAQQIELSCSTIGAEIRYTTDGSEPGETSALYTTPISLTTSTTIKAKAFRDKYLPSAVSEAIYTIVISDIAEPEENYSLKIYPVPAAEYVKIELDGLSADKVDLSIINTTGQVVYSNSIKATEAVEVDLGRLNPGTYMILLNTGKDKITRKLIKL